MSIRKYNEFYNYKIQSLTSIDKHNIASISDNGTGIEGVIVWIGGSKIDGNIVLRVSNKPEDLSGVDLFSINVDNFRIIGSRNKSFITDGLLEDIISFIVVNKTLIIKFTNEEIFVDELVDKLLPYSIIHI